MNVLLQPPVGGAVCFDRQPRTVASDIGLSHCTQNLTVADRMAACRRGLVLTTVVFPSSWYPGARLLP